MLLYTPPPRTDPWLLKHYNYNGISSHVVDVIIVDNTGVLVRDDVEFYLYIGTQVRAM